MNLRRLHARLDHLELLASKLPSRRDRDRLRREELKSRKFGPAGLTENEEAELLVLDGLFEVEDRELARSSDLTCRQIMAAIGKQDPLTDDETRELAELESRYLSKPVDSDPTGPTDPDPCEPTMVAIRAILEEIRRTSR